ncbi:MAG: guanitoxin biosynthesis pre-guanitoxin forming N-methyltransferase GntF [Roseiflexaceae bacterium]|nr:guanitoxin biosynthesis pre-guanitoxin forming N-methyltransferase GntF [Roseiflexaceae bacterium]
MHNTYPIDEPLSVDVFQPFDPKAYLIEYYSYLGEENRALLHFLDAAYARIFTEKQTASVVEFGGGPTIYQLISAARYPVMIDFSDYLDENLGEVQQWLQDLPGQFCWDEFIHHVLDLEGVSAKPLAFQQRKQHIREKVSQLFHCDAKKANPLESNDRSAYDIVSINFVLESITTEMQEWHALFDHVLPLVETHGYLLMCAILGATYYRVGDRFFPAVPITADILEAKLTQLGFSIVLADTINAEHKDAQGYDGICMVLAQRNASL